MHPATNICSLACFPEQTFSLQSDNFKMAELHENPVCQKSPRTNVNALPAIQGELM